MCDTLVALGNSTLDGSIVFGKNSNRPNDEVQLITYSPKNKYSKGEELNCTYISIPQASETAAIILSQPWWIWGAEMGVNEYGVVIGRARLIDLVGSLQAVVDGYNESHLSQPNYHGIWDYISWCKSPVGRHHYRRHDFANLMQ